VFLFITANDFQSRRQYETNLKRLERPPRSNPAEPALVVINDVGYYAFLRQLIRQAQGFMANGCFASLSPKSTARAQPQAKMAQPDLVQVVAQLDPLRQQWGDRLVIIYHSFAPGIGRYPTAACNDQVWQEIQEQGIASVNLCPAFSQAYLSRTPPAGFSNSILGRGHLNAHGHALVAAEVLDFLEFEDGLH
jgi:hypothetical protein